MKASADEAAQFRKQCEEWQHRFGLTDWTLQFKTEEANGRLDEAEVDFDCDTRHAKITYFLGVEDGLHPADVALHEILHLLVADTVVAAIHARDESDPLLGREEHKMIERLIKAFNVKGRAA